MIPFGFRRPILSLVSHEKLRRFLEDIEAEGWAVEIDDPDLADRLAQAALDQLERPDASRSQIERAQDRLRETTLQNLREISRGFGLGEAQLVGLAEKAV